MGRIEQAIRFMERALVAAQAQKDRATEGVCLGNLAVCLSDLGHSAEAVRYLEQSLVIAREFGDRRHEAEILANLAIEYAAAGRKFKGN